MLVASPDLQDPHFVQSLVFLMDAGAEGAFGFVVNRPMGMALGDLPIGRDLPDPLPLVGVHFGGPVQADGLVFAVFRLGATDDHVQCELVREPIRLLASVNRADQWPRAFAGYAGWGKGQLESELARGDWTLCPPSAALFARPVGRESWTAFTGPDQRWRRFWRNVPPHPERN